MNHESVWQIAGLAFVLVFFALGALSALLFALRALGRRTTAALDGAAIDDETLAILAAGIEAALGAPIVIRHVHVHRAGGEGWERAGRMDILGSHRVVSK